MTGSEFLKEMLENHIKFTPPKYKEVLINHKTHQVTDMEGNQIDPFEALEAYTVYEIDDDANNDKLGRD